MGNKHVDDTLSNNKVIRGMLRDLDTGVGSLVSLMKMLVIKHDEADQNYNRLRNCVRNGEISRSEINLIPRTHFRLL